MIHDWISIRARSRKSRIKNQESRIENDSAPAAAERPIEMDDGCELLPAKTREIELALEQVALGVEDLQVAVDSRLVPLRRQPRRGPQGVDEPRLFDALFARLPILRERIRHLAKGRIDRALVVDDQLPLNGFGKLDVRAGAPCVEDRRGGACRERPRACR